MLAIGMLVAGSANTITCKLALSSLSPTSPGSEPKAFDHPFVMAGFMFFGECLCLAAFRVKEACRTEPRSAAARAKREGKQMPCYAFALPACCDLMGTSVMYVGLTLTTASTYQMLRGSVIIFTGILSSVYLKRKQYGFHWLAMLLVVAGVLTVGTASILTAGVTKAAGNSLLGNGLVVLSQLFTALQMCLEERFVTGYNLPALVAVGSEGIWGLLFLLWALFVLQHVYFNGQPMENSVEALHQVQHAPKILIVTFGNSLSIAFFNFFGMSITKTSSAAYRMVLDSLRTVAIWLFDLASGGGTFHPLQVVGFSLMLVGTTVYNETVHVPGFHYPSEQEKQQRQSTHLQQRAEPLLNAGRAVLPLKPFSASPTMKVDDFFTPSLSRFTIQKN